MEEQLVKPKPAVLIKMLKDQLRDEIREEIRQEFCQQNQEKPWEKVRDHINKRLGNTTLLRWHTYKLQNAIYIIIRYSLDIPRVSDLQAEQVEQAIAVADSCITMASFPEVSESAGDP